MIFITVGTHEQPFDRLLKCVDKMIEDGKIAEDVICQKGYTSYDPKNFKAEKLIPYIRMKEHIARARIVITHGGPASFIAPLSMGKIPIVVPRKKEFNEHVNNHQVDFAKYVKEKMQNIIVAETEDEIIDAIILYNEKIKNLNTKNNSNNSIFCEKLEKEILDLFNGKTSE